MKKFLVTYRVNAPDWWLLNNKLQESTEHLGWRFELYRQPNDDEDLKGITVLFASDAGKHITGQWLAIDGGVSCVTGG